MKTATTTIEMKVETIIIGTNIVSVNQVLITIRLNPFGKNKAKRYFRHSLQRSVSVAPLS